VAFLSNRTGGDELWVADGDGGNAVQLTNLGMPLQDVAWAPDERWVAVSAVSGRVFLVSVETRSVRQVFSGPAFTDERVPDLAFSRDGKSPYVVSQGGVGEKYELLKVSVDGGTPLKILDGRITNVAESPNGRTLFYSRAKPTAGQKMDAIWKRPVEGGAERFVVAAPGPWDIVASGLYLITESGTIDRYSLAGKRVQTVARLGPEGSGWPISVAPDGKAALLAQRKSLTIEIDSVRGVK
jgi:hypothetical protein